MIQKKNIYESPFRSGTTPIYLVANVDEIHVDYATQLMNNQVQYTPLPQVIKAFSEPTKDIFVKYKHQNYNVYYFGSFKQVKTKYITLQDMAPNSKAFKILKNSLVGRTASQT